MHTFVNDQHRQIVTQAQTAAQNFTVPQPSLPSPMVGPSPSTISEEDDAVIREAMDYDRIDPAAIDSSLRSPPESPPSFRYVYQDLPPSPSVGPLVPPTPTPSAKPGTPWWMPSFLSGFVPSLLLSEGIRRDAILALLCIVAVVLVTMSPLSETVIGWLRPMVDMEDVPHGPVAIQAVLVATFVVLGSHWLTSS